MKISLITIGLLCFFANISMAQNDYYKLKLKGGSEIYGQLLSKENYKYCILTNNSDTINISERTIRSAYLIPGFLEKAMLFRYFKKDFFGDCKVNLVTVKLTIFTNHFIFN
ncbi:MAG: hypothetical protein HC803_09245 [Saprospiraceae bacterium]|nr:hypothetical protein [Saprospiraceae bacterium]